MDNINTFVNAIGNLDEDALQRWSTIAASMRAARSDASKALTNLASRSCKL